MMYRQHALSATNMNFAAKGPMGMAKSRVLSEETLTRVR